MTEDDDAMVIKRETRQYKHNRGCRSETKQGEEAKQNKESKENGGAEANNEETEENSEKTDENDEEYKKHVENVAGENNVEKE